jgi:hypothetical protein
MKIAVAALILITSAGAQQMHIKPFDSQTISVAPVAGHPFGIEIGNQGDEPIEALSIRWDYTRADTGAAGTEVAAKYAAVGLLLYPGTKKTFLPDSLDARIKPGTEPNVTLDGVLYSSGRVVGENRFGIDKHMDLMAESARYVATGIIKRDPRLHEPWLKTLTEARVAGDSRIGGGAFWRTVFIAGAAREYLGLRNLGPAAIMARAKQNIERSESRLRHNSDVPRGGR